MDATSRHVLVLACSVTAYGDTLQRPAPSEAPHQKGNNYEAPPPEEYLRVQHMDYGIHTVKRGGQWCLRTHHGPALNVNDLSAT